MMSEPVSALMTTPVTTVSADDTVEAVGEQLRRAGLSFVPVVERPNGPPLGIISAADLVQFESAKRDPVTVQAWQVCSYKPLEVSPDTPVGEVAKLMVEQQVHHVLVTRDKRIEGVVSALDFVRRFIPPT